MGPASYVEPTIERSIVKGTEQHYNIPGANV